MQLSSRLKPTFRALVIILLVTLVVIELLRLILYMRIDAKVSESIEQQTRSLLNEKE